MINISNQKDSNSIDPLFVNLHTHSFYCGHGVGELSEYTENAKKAGLKVLGFSEHCPVKENRWRSSRMAYNQLLNYVNDVRKEKEKNQKEIQILLGAECDWTPKGQYYSFYKDYLLGELGFDYLLIGAHAVEVDGDDLMVYRQPQSKLILHKYTDNVISAIESGLFITLNHPDIFANSYRVWDDETKACSKEILKCAETYGVAVEINGNGLRKKKITTPNGLRQPYPIKEFWELTKDYDLKITMSSDAHQPKQVATLKDCISFAKELDLKLSYYNFT